MDADVVRPAERRRVGESEGCATMLKMCDVVDFEETGPTATPTGYGTRTEGQPSTSPWRTPGRCSRLPRARALAG